MHTSEIHSYLAVVGTFGLQQVPVGLLGQKGSEHHVIGQEVDVGHTCYGVDVQCVSPHGVLSDVGFARWNHHSVTECQHLAALTVGVVAVHVVEGIHPVGAWCHSLDGEVSAAVGACHPAQGFFGKNGVAQVAV